MNRNRAAPLLPILFAVALLLAAPFAIGQQPAQYKVVFQVSDADPAKWALALGNAHNAQVDLGKDKVQIEIVAYGPGLGMLREGSKVEGRLAEALENNIGLIACENTMRALNLTKADMYPGIGFAPAGITHIMKRQMEGWAYIRP
jgi:intracellular sulfur oxidation DsrE/DsrF family protein